jgi:hypothetical protein
MDIKIKIKNRNVKRKKKKKKPQEGVARAGSAAKIKERGGLGRDRARCDSLYPLERSVISLLRERPPLLRDIPEIYDEAGIQWPLRPPPTV